MLVTHFILSFQIPTLEGAKRQTKKEGGFVNWGFGGISFRSNPAPQISDDHRRNVRVMGKPEGALGGCDCPFRPLVYFGPITTQPFLKLPIAAKLGKSQGTNFDDAGRGRGWLWLVVVGYHSEIGRATPGYYGGSTPAAFFAGVHRQDHRLQVC